MRRPAVGERASLPAHLPRFEVVIEPDNPECACGGALHRIGEDRCERLDIIPAQHRVMVTIRPRYACRCCTDGVHQASAPAHVVPGGLPTEALIANVLRSEEHTSELQSLMRISYAVFCLTKKTKNKSEKDTLSH